MIQYDPHRWFDYLFDVKSSMTLAITPRVLACVFWAGAVVAFDRWAWPAGVPSTVHTLVGTALGLLLVFRTNSSYDRFWEGRRLWGNLINECRNLARCAAVHLKADPVIQDHVIRWTGIFPYAVKNVLRGTEGLGPIADELPKAELDWVIH